MPSTFFTRAFALCTVAVLATGCVAVPGDGYYETQAYPTYNRGYDSGVLYGPGAYAPGAYTTYPAYPVYPSYPAVAPSYYPRGGDHRGDWRERDARDQRDRVQQQHRDAQDRDARQRGEQARQQRERDDSRRQQAQQQERQQQERERRASANRNQRDPGDREGLRRWRSASEIERSQGH
ncbi:hypothetical protein B2J86_17190 [Acidovorax sp. SRB_14]|uniref:hypothetical protein n=1 Tax=unclassified Acidovorax TaxID=2684926 RepID=UPI00145F0742|nr:MULTISPECIES: hypothetical protein [unclassified Acidovorax]NMM78980.1 hypothetical protein [Acidovorax sp. SRB_24]NMM82636.1 hypothetical protein [Acidovorax sp. SRB_14]NMM87285.1 hypothetical protein [Rhodococcus sp. SRB_17]